MADVSSIPNLQELMIGDSATITLTQDQLAATIGDEVVLLGLETGMYYGLEAVAAHVWRHLQHARTFGEVVDEVMNVFEARRDDVVRDMSEFVRTLEAEGLVTISSSEAA